MKWFAGPHGGGWYALTRDLVSLLQREVPRLGLDVVAGGGRENPLAIQSGGKRCFAPTLNAVADWG